MRGPPDLFANRTSQISRLERKRIISMPFLAGCIFTPQEMNGALIAGLPVHGANQRLLSQVHSVLKPDNLPFDKLL